MGTDKECPNCGSEDTSVFFKGLLLCSSCCYVFKRHHAKTIIPEKKKDVEKDNIDV